MAVLGRILTLGFLLTFSAEAKLSVVKTDHPRDTMKSFLEAMQDYKLGIESGNGQLKRRINDAVRTLDISTLPAILKTEKARESAIFLKEVIDRVIVVDYSKIPADEALSSNLLRWRLKGTEITIRKVEEGDRAGEYLFSSGTVERAQDFFEQVEDDPYLDGSGGGAGYDKPWVDSASPEWLRQPFLGFAKWQWLGLVFCVFFGFFLKAVSRYFLLLAKVFTAKTQSQWDDKIIDAVEKPFSWFVLGLVWFFSVYLLRFEGVTLQAVQVMGQVVFSVGVVWAFYRLSDVLIQYVQHLLKKTGGEIDEHLIPLLRSTLKVSIAIMGVLVAIQNLGVNVASLIAGLGLGGLAFALAAKDTASNFFGSITVFIDRPFRVGDWIKVGDQEGTVESIGFRSTRMRTFYDSQISVPNSVVANAHIDNMGRRKYRRVYTRLGVTYDTSPDKMKKFVDGIREIIKKFPTTRKDLYHIYFNEYGASCLEVMVYFFLKVPSWAEELKDREAVFAEIYQLADQLQVEFAFPTQTIHLEKGNS
ncbi:mechanosensitive ion channel family protein [bacterium]|nr:mechanosensitive ion channel family protein [bacterium]